MSKTIESQTYQSIKELVLKKNILISSHGYDELAEDGLLVTDVIASISEATVVEDYPDAFKGASVLLLQQDRYGNPMHTVWGIPKEKSEPAVLITAYIPSEEKWDKTFTRRNNA
ncbi:MAG: DUF4258 domain-containing protein [Campylobacterota bacterium]|nr:DUF4258 domain-containing protein [Campylobacterota bacterium]